MQAILKASLIAEGGVLVKGDEAEEEDDEEEGIFRLFVLSGA